MRAFEEIAVVPLLRRGTFDVPFFVLHECERVFYLDVSVYRLLFVWHYTSANPARKLAFVVLHHLGHGTDLLGRLPVTLPDVALQDVILEICCLTSGTGIFRAVVP